MSRIVYVATFSSFGPEVILSVHVSEEDAEEACRKRAKKHGESNLEFLPNSNGRWTAYGGSFSYTVHMTSYEGGDDEKTG